MRRSGKKKRSPELVLLQANFRLEVVFAGDEEGAAQPCHFGPLGCEGRIEAAHWISRQRLNNALYAHGLGPDERQVAEWDPRNAVPSCTSHHRRFDSHRGPPLIVYRHEVPELVEMFAEDWGLGGSLADRHPSISAECPVKIGQANEEERFAAEIPASERALFDD